MSAKKQDRNLLKNIFSNIHFKYKIVVTNESTFEETLSFRLSRMNIFILIGVITILSIAFTIFVIWITPLKEYIPGYASVDKVHQVYINQAKIDSLQKKYEQEVVYRENFRRRILLGEDLSENDTILPTKKTDIDYDNIPDVKTEREKKLRKQWDNVNDYDLVYGNNKVLTKGIGRFVFYTPVHGIISNGFDAEKSHFGIDIVCKKDATIKSTLDGRVIFSEWTYQGGYVITIQHEDDLVSVYKHNARLLKKQGDIVKAGDPIAIVGNTGKLTSGLHLHFELWYKNSAVNPADFISFN